MKKDETVITDIVSKEALAQVDLLNDKLEKSLVLEKKLANNVVSKVQVLSGLVNGGLNVNGEVLKLANNKLKDLIPLL